MRQSHGQIHQGLVVACHDGIDLIRRLKVSMPLNCRAVAVMFSLCMLPCSHHRTRRGGSQRLSTRIT
jgi:hypothetical protein